MALKYPFPKNDKTPLHIVCSIYFKYNIQYKEKQNKLLSTCCFMAKDKRVFGSYYLFYET